MAKRKKPDPSDEAWGDLKHAELMSRVTLPPFADAGWTMKATETSGGGVAFRSEYRTQRDPVGMISRDGVLTVEWVMTAAPTSDEAFFDALARAITEVVLHEVRELFLVDGKAWMQPHRPSGHEAWRRMVGLPMNRELGMGIADRA